MHHNNADLRRRMRISPDALVSPNIEDPGALLKPVPADKEKCPKSVCTYKRERTKKKAEELAQWSCKNC